MTCPYCNNEISTNDRTVMSICPRCGKAVKVEK